MKRSGFIKKSSSVLILFVFFFNQSIHAKSTNDIIKNKHQTIELRFDSSFNAIQKSRATLWVTHASDALKTVYGEFPVDYFVTQLKASRRGSDPVPWGEVNRKSPSEVVLVINKNASLNQLNNDWTIYHEFSHLLIPYDAGDERWLSEGLASYYQNILQARIGMFDEQKMWQKLFEGFERARKQTNYSHQKLSYLSENMESNRNFMRIYWSGALYWLEADIALRLLNNEQSLDSALLKLRRCCFKDPLSAAEIIHQLDRLTNSKIFSRLFQRFSTSSGIPTYNTLLNSLGAQQKNGTISLTNDANFSELRKAIYKGNLSSGS
jgi:hypothetical protein